LARAEGYTGAVLVEFALVVPLMLLLVAAEWGANRVEVGAPHDSALGITRSGDRNVTRR
jgi:hypothetical protein